MPQQPLPKRTYLPSGISGRLISSMKLSAMSTGLGRKGHIDAARQN